MPIEKGEPRLTLTDAPDERAQAVIRGGLSEYNLGKPDIAMRARSLSWSPIPRTER